MEEMDRSTTYLMRRIVSAIETAVNKRARARGVRIEEIWVLFRLLAKDNQTVGELAVETGIERSTLSRVLTRMQEKRLVNRRRLEQDQRTVRITLTDKGQLLAQSRHPTFRDYEALVVRGFSAEEVRLLKSMLIRMIPNAIDIGVESGNVTPARKRAGTKKPAPINNRVRT
jgi:MarR family transcriptional regulator, organic hydroperoxide resistance regulator